MPNVEPTLTVVTDRPGDEPKPDIKPVMMSPYQIVGVRVARTAVQVFLGILLGLMGTGLIPYETFADLLVKAASLSAAPITIALLQNVLELLGSLDKTDPKWRA